MSPRVDVERHREERGDRLELAIGVGTDTRRDRKAGRRVIGVVVGAGASGARSRRARGAIRGIASCLDISFCLVVPKTGQLTGTCLLLSTRRWMNALS